MASAAFVAVFGFMAATISSPLLGQTGYTKTFETEPANHGSAQVAQTNERSFDVLRLKLGRPDRFYQLLQSFDEDACSAIENGLNEAWPPEKWTGANPAEEFILGSKHNVAWRKISDVLSLNKVAYATYIPFFDSSSYNIVRRYESISNQYFAVLYAFMGSELPVEALSPEDIDRIRGGFIQSGPLAGSTENEIIISRKTIRNNNGTSVSGDVESLLKDAALYFQISRVHGRVFIIAAPVNFIGRPIDVLAVQMKNRTEGALWCHLRARYVVRKLG